ncbi:hypothetical protein DFH08DRAFT_806190 [Mycena albidolilacea]|uniref:Uncharacterized protein n=1 Tax=Mycena albidolilacea TaxID=1033008 RepID=A0AAD7ETU0_9AGAR|nr:hypothetical protein DFH08DRAFT_806190 [Mycena albidolilacea]
MQSKLGRWLLLPDSILAADLPHAYGLNLNPPLQNPANPHQMSLPFFYKSPADSKPQSVQINLGGVILICVVRLCSVATSTIAIRYVKEWTGNYFPFLIQYTAKNTGKMMMVHLILYTLRMLGLPKLPSENHEFLLMVVIDLVSISPPPSDSWKPQKCIAVTNILPVPICLVLQEIVDIHHAVVAGMRAEVCLHSIWITTTSVYQPGKEERLHVSVLTIRLFVLQNVGNLMFTLYLYSRSYGLYQHINFDLDFLFTKSVLYLLDFSFYLNIDSAYLQSKEINKRFKMESMGTLHPYKPDHVTMGSSKSRVLEKILIISFLYQGPGTEFQTVKCYSFFVDSAKTSGTLVEPMVNHSRSSRGHHNISKGPCRVVPGQPEVAVLWLCIPNLLHKFFKTALFEVKSR